MQLTILGMKANKGQMDNGTQYDSTKVYVQTRLDDSKGTAKGVATTEYNFGTSAEFDKFKHLPFPFRAEVELDMVTSGKATKTIIVAMQPLDMKTAAPSVKA